MTSSKVCRLKLPVACFGSRSNESGLAPLAYRISLMKPKTIGSTCARNDCLSFVAGRIAKL